MAKKKRGRPPRNPGQLLRGHRGFRIGTKLDESLQKAAAKAGRSVSEEIEHRLQRSFYDDAMAERFLGSNVAGELLRLVRGACAFAGVDEGDWAEDRDRAEQLRVAINVMIAVLTDLPVELPETDLREKGNRLAAFLLASSSVRLSLPPWLLAYPETGRLHRQLS